MIIIIGGAGFIGSHICAAFEQKKTKRLVVCDYFGTESKWCNIAKREIFNFVHPRDLFSFLESNKNLIEAVFHMGASSSGSSSSQADVDVDVIVENNIHLSTQLLHWCGRYRVRFFYASAAATYGDGRAGYLDDASRAHLARLRPQNPYGWSKHAFDRIVAQTIESKDSPMPPQWAGFKFFNVYGPNEYHKEEQMSLVPQLFSQIQATGMARLFKSDRIDMPDGGQMRDFIYIRDCVDIMMWLYEHPEVSGLFNVGTGIAHSFNDLARAIFKATGIEPNIDYFDMPEILRGQYQYFTQADMTKLRSVGYDKPFMPLEAGVAEYVQRYLTQEDQYLE